MTEPVEPGWHTDPWNPSASRWWDGSNWSGHTTSRPSEPPDAATATSAPPTVPDPATKPPDPEVATQPSAPSRLAGLPKPPPVVIVALVLALALIIGVVIVSGRGSGRSVAGSAEPTLPPVPSTAPPGHSAGLSAAVVTAADLGAGWTPLTPAKPLSPDEYTQSVCGSSLWAQDTNGYGSTFQEGSGQYAHRVVESTVLEAPSIQVADQQRALVASPSFVPCVKQVVGAVLLSAFDTTDQPQIVQLSADPLNLNLNTPVTGYVVTVGVSLLGGQVRVTFNDDVIITFSGRYMGTLDIAWCSCTRAGQELVEPQTNLLAQRLAALPPNLAKGASA